MLRHTNFKASVKGLMTALLVMGVLVFASIEDAMAACRGAWAEGVTYAAGDTVTYNGSVYTARTAHGCNGCGWNPVAAPSLWAPGGTCSTTPTSTPTPTATVRPTPTPTTRPTPTPTTTVRPTPTPTATVRPTPTPTVRPTPTPTTTTCNPAWNATTAYSGGARVTHNGVNYEAKWWTQGNDPSTNSCADCAWRNLGNCSTNPTPTPTPTATVRPTPTPTAPPAGARRYVTYASTWNTSIYDLTPANVPSYITAVNLAFARPDTAYARGSFEFDQAVAGFEFFEGATTNTGQKKFTAQQKTDLRNNIAALRARGTQVWVSVGGWSYSQGDQWSRFSAPRVVDLALDLGASGVDIDWESSTSSCTKGTASAFRCTKDAEIIGIISSLRNEINARASGMQISIAGWSTGAYYVVGSPFEEGKVQWGSPFGGTLYRLVADHGSKINFINLMSYDAGDYYDPREGYESYRAIYAGPINMGMEIAPEGAGGAILEVNAPAGTVYDAEMMTGLNNVADRYYNVQTMVNYIKNKGRSNDGFMMWQLWKQRVHQPAPAGAATENSAGQYVCRNLPLTGDCNATIPNLPKL
jgi:chitinase